MHTCSLSWGPGGPGWALFTKCTLLIILESKLNTECIHLHLSTGFPPGSLLPARPHISDARQISDFGHAGQSVALGMHDKFHFLARSGIFEGDNLRCVKLFLHESERALADHAYTIIKARLHDGIRRVRGAIQSLVDLFLTLDQDLST